jgi:cell wall-associated NlpC family hydrolase
MTTTYLNIPWRDGGMDRSGLDCRGLAWLWLKEHGLIGPQPITPKATDGGKVTGHLTELTAVPFLTTGDLIFFREKRTGRVNHVAIYLAGEGYLHTVKGCASRIDRNTTLIERLGWEVAGLIPGDRAEQVVAALRDPHLGGWETVILLIVSIALSAASAFLQSKPKLGQFRNSTGRYGFDQLFTQTSTTLPLPIILGAVTVAGNQPYQSLIDKSQPVSDATQQKINKVVVLGAGPVTGFDYTGNIVKINGLPYDNTYWHASGFALNPTQDKANAVDGTIGSEANRPSLTTYDAAHALSVPVDVRAQYDRNFPVYGFNGVAYLAFRLIDSSKLNQFNLTCTVKGMALRTFDASGFIVATATGESLTGADGSKVRFKLAQADIKAITSLTVNSEAYTAASADQPAGNVYRLNPTKGYIEFFTAPAMSATISVTYDYYPREWSQNPVSQIVYLLTEPIRGKGFSEAKIDWARAVEARDFCDEEIVWENASGTYIGPRFTSNYVLDYRKPIQEHIRAILDAFYGFLFLSGGQFVIKARTSGASVFSFNPANILKDSFFTEMIDRAQLANQIRIFYHSLDTLNAETEVVKDDLVNQENQAARVGNFGVKPETYRMLAVDSQQQAERLAQTILSENVNLKWIGELKTNLQGLALEPGDIIDVTHPSQPAWDQKLVRIEDLTLDEKDHLTLRFSEYFEGAYV